MQKSIHALTICSFIFAISCKSSGSHIYDHTMSDSLIESSNNDTSKHSLFVGNERHFGDVTKQLYQELDSVDVYNDEVLRGYWFKPHEASHVNIFFHQNNMFEINYYIATPDNLTRNMYKTGTYKQIGDSIFLRSKDGWELSIRHWRPRDREDGFYITKGTKPNWDIYLVKGSN